MEGTVNLSLDDYNEIKGKDFSWYEIAEKVKQEIGKVDGEIINVECYRSTYCGTRIEITAHPESKKIEELECQVKELREKLSQSEKKVMKKKWGF